MDKLTEGVLFLGKLRKFLKDNGFSISHEDTQGGFILVEYNDYYDKWLAEAGIDIGIQETEEINEQE